MPIEEFIISVYLCLCKTYSEVTNDTKIRKSGPDPELTDVELLTMEVAGEFLGINEDKKIWFYFKTSWAHYFPNIGSRSSFVKQSINLTNIKKKIYSVLKEQLTESINQEVSIADGVPIPVCKYARASRHKNFKAEAAFSYCAAKDEKYYGFKGNIVTTNDGVIIGFNLAPSNLDEREALLEMADSLKNLLIADKGYIGKEWQEAFSKAGIDLQTPLRSNMKETRSKWFLKYMMKTRKTVETVISQLTERFSINKVKARTMWTLTNRIARKLLSHTMAIFINKQQGNELLQFDKLVKI